MVYECRECIVNGNLSEDDLCRQLNVLELLVTFEVNRLVFTFYHLQISEKYFPEQCFGLKIRIYLTLPCS